MKTVQIQPFFFAFESDFVNTLKCLPMIVRYKLDRCVVKLKLSEWVKFSLRHKESLASRPCFTSKEIAEYGDFVKKLVQEYSRHEASILFTIDDSWNNIHEIPQEVQQKAAEWGCPEIKLKCWIELNTLQRFALVKLSRSGHEGRNFPVALREFGIIGD